MAEYELRLDGDLCQMAEQTSFLRQRGFELRASDVHRYVKSEDSKRALRLIYLESVEGWWHYEDKLVEAGFCTHEEFMAKLQLAVDTEKLREGRL